MCVYKYLYSLHNIFIYYFLHDIAVDHSISLLSTTTVNADPTISISNTFSNVVVSSSMSTTLVEPTAAICASPQAVVITSTLISTFPTTTVTVTSTVSATQSQCTTVTFPTTTATVTSTVSATPSQCITVIISPSTAQSSNQQITDKGDSSCNAIAICIPVAVLIAVVVCVIVFVAVWRLRHKAIYNFATSNPQMAKIYNDLYGSVILYS